MDQQLDRAYSARGTVSAETFETVMRCYREASVRASRGLVGHRDLPFDASSDERLDVFGVEPGELRPTVLAVHGGYWRSLSRLDTAFMADVLAARGVATVTVDYTLAASATLEEMVRQVRTAVSWVHAHGGEHGLDPERLVVTGSSAGAHLASMTLVGGWHDEYDVPEDAVSAGLLLSGLYDLRPLLHCAPNEWLRLDDERASALSPRLAPAGSAPVVVALAENEAAGFAQQSAAFHDHWSRHAPTGWRQVAGRNHFDVFLDLADPTSALFGDLLDLVAQTG